MIDENSTSRELAKAKPKMAILPVGAFEQHFGVLPLNTDNLEVGALARALASHYDAFLLPAQPFGTSLENTGSAGTVTLMPSTLMSLTKDIVEGLYRQGFKYVVLVNGHGGNFVLRPAVREINYRNDGCKTIYVEPWVMVPAAEESEIFEGDNELHAGEVETSVMMYLHPELVRRDCLEDGNPAAARGELDMFSLPSLSEGLPWGKTSLASADKGRRHFNLMVKYTIQFIDRVIGRHESGSGTYHL